MRLTRGKGTTAPMAPRTIPARGLPRLAGLAMFAISLVVLGTDPAGARGPDARRKPPDQSFRPPSTPLLAVVSLSDQHVTIYDAGGKILQSPVSSGAKGYETPAGIYSVVQKKEIHQSNLYEDGSMPFMQRITWTGIALHAGVLPGQPASHGCVRLPIAFAQRLFDLTDLGLRVIVVRDDVAPADIAHPVLFKPDPARIAAAVAPAPAYTGQRRRRAPGAERDTAPTRASAAAPGFLDALKAQAAARSDEAETATRTAKDTRQAAGRKAAEAAAAARGLRAAQDAHARAEKGLKDAEAALEAAASVPEKAGPAELAKAKAQERLGAAAAQLQLATDQAQAKADAATRASNDARAADDARDAAIEAAGAAARKTQPVSIFVSRKARRLYIRQGTEPVYEGPVTIRDAGKPIGTFVFTAMDDGMRGADPRWSVVSMYKYADNAEPVAQAPRGRGSDRNAGPIPADVAAAKAALDRIAIPREIVAEFTDIVLPGSSFIISDESAHIETGKDTDFVVIMSGEPQGGITTRRREPIARYDNFFGGPKSKGFWFWD